jgi:LysM repeat protein
VRFKVLAVVLAVLGGALVLGEPASASHPVDDRSWSGVDYAWYRPSDSELRSSGVSFVARYLVPRSFRNGKALTASEAASLRARGYVLLLNYELAASSARGGYPAGQRDAQRAELARREVGAPALPIYFSVDYDERNAAVIKEYLAGVASVIGTARTGVYGGYYAVHAALDAGYSYAWQTYAWSYGRWDARAQVRQVHNGALFHGQGDLDEAVYADFGGWGGALDSAARNFAAPRASVPATGGTYVVQRGDTLGGIARRFGTSVSALARLNGIHNPNRIYAGQRIRLTAPSSSRPPVVSHVAYYTVRRGDTLGQIASRNRTTVRQLAALNHIHNVNRIYAGQRLKLR